MSASPVPPLSVTLRLVWPAGTAIVHVCCAPVAPERPVTGTPLDSTLPPVLPLTETDALAAWLVEPEVPVMVAVPEPLAVELAVRVNVELPPAATDVGLNDPVTPAGSPLTESDT